MFCERGDFMKTFFSPVACFAVLLFSSAGTVQVIVQKTSGVYLTAANFKNGQVSFEGDCGSKTHKLELHHVLEAKELYVYSREVPVSHGRGIHTCRGYFFGVGPEGTLRA